MLHFKTFHTRSIGWALFGVNIRPWEKIEAIRGVGGYLILGPFSWDHGKHVAIWNLMVRANCIKVGLPIYVPSCLLITIALVKLFKKFSSCTMYTMWAWFFMTNFQKMARNLDHTIHDRRRFHSSNLAFQIWARNLALTRIDFLYSLVTFAVFEAIMFMYITDIQVASPGPA